MDYIENDFYPAWVPAEYRNFVDLSELAEPTKEIIEKANSLMEILGVNIAVYKGINSPKRKSNGLCSIFKSAILQDEKLESVLNAEQELGNYIIVAYANPLQYHSN